MSQFDVHRARATGTLLVDCQTNFLRHLPTRFVVPLLPLNEAPIPAQRFNPIFSLNGSDYMLAPQYAGSVSAGDLGPVQDTLAEDYMRITAALDFLIGGF